MDQKTRRVIDHRSQLLLINVSLVVSKAGRSRVIREKAKNVHAYAIGEIGSYVANDVTTTEATYNPYRADYFFEKESNIPRQEADVAIFTDTGRLFLSEKWLLDKPVLTLYIAELRIRRLHGGGTLV